MRMHGIILGGAIMCAALLIYIQAASFPIIPGQAFGSGDFPKLAAMGLGLCGSLLLGMGCIDLFRNKQALGLVVERIAVPQQIDMAFIIGAIVFYIVAVPRIGFPPGVFICVLTLCIRFGGRPIQAFAFAAAVTIVLYGVFGIGLKIALPLGPIAALIYSEGM